MYLSKLFAVLSAALATSCLLAPMVAAAPAGGPPKIQRDGTMNIAGRNVRCGGVRNVLDASLPSEGAAAPGVLVINPRLISRMPQIVRLFVFNHECGHHNIGPSELKADCWAVDQGVKQGWLDKTGLNQVCKSFGNMPETATHPSGKRRCNNLNQCFARAVAKKEMLEAAKRPETTPAAAQQLVPAPTLVSGPTLVGKGTAADDETRLNAPARPEGR